MANKLTEETIELVKEYLAKETEGLITEFTNLLNERDKLENEFLKAEDSHESFKYRTIWENCRDRLKRYDKKEIKSKEFEHDFFLPKSEVILFTSPLIINDINLHNLNDYDFCMKDLWQRSYSKIEFQKAISYIQKYIDLYKECIASRNNFIAENYYSTFIQELKGLVLFYERSVKESDRKKIKETISEVQEQELFDELQKLTKEKDKLCYDHCDVLRNPISEPGRIWLACRNSIKETIGLSSMAEKEDKYLPSLNDYQLARFLYDEEFWGKRPKIVELIEKGYIEIAFRGYPKEDLLVAKKYMEQNLNDLKASIALAKECISSNYYGNFLDDLEVLVRKY